MPDNQLPGVTIPPGKTFPESDWFERPDIEPGTPFLQTPSPDKEGVKGSISPHQLFSLFTFEIIRENKVFVR